MATVWTKLGIRTARAVQLLTEVAPADVPPAVPSVGVQLQGVDAIMPVIVAPGGQTFTGAGLLLGWAYGPDGWSRAPRADLDLADAAGLSQATLSAVPVTSPAGYFIWVPSGVGLSGAGTTLSTTYICTVSKGEFIL